MNEKLMPLEDWRTCRFTRPPDPRTVRKWCERGDIPAKKIGIHWFVVVNEEVAHTGNKKVDDLVNLVLKAG